MNPLPAHLRATRAGLEALDAFSRRLASAQDLDALMSETITALVEVFGYQHCVLLVANETGDSLYAVASHGYPESGAGAEIAVGEGPIGVAATRGVPVRVTNVAIASWYARSGGDHSAREIAFPRHAQAMSQLAVPIILGDRLLGAIFLESEVVGHFGEVDEQAANVVASQVGWAMSTLRGQPVLGSGRREDPGGATRREAAAHIRHYAEDDSIFMNGDYLIKGLAGRVLWRMLQAYEEERRVEFTNKEMRLDASLELSDFRDNLENRLILLRRRLEDRCDFVRIQNTGRGRFSLVVQRELELQEIPARP